MVKIVKNYFQKAFEVIRNPKEFFKDLDTEKNIKVSILYLLFLVVFSIIASFLTSIVLVAISNPGTDLAANLPQAILYFLINGLMLFIFNLVGGVAFHLYLKLFRSTGKLKDSVKLYIYASTPVLLFGWLVLPLVVTLSTLYNFYLLYIGAMEIHGLTKKRAIIALIVIPVILLLISALVPTPQY